MLTLVVHFRNFLTVSLLEVQDDMESIAKGVRDVMWIAKGTGGIGISLNKLRAAGSPVKTTNTDSTGPIPFMKMIDTALFAVSRKGKKAGCSCYLHGKLAS